MDRNTTILLVEDDPTIAEGLVAALEHERFRAIHVDNGEAALEAIKRDPPDLVLCDIMLPGIDGLTVMRKVKDSHQDLPIILLTARTEEIDRVMGLELGADDYITKPFSTQELLARIRAVLRRRAPEVVNDTVQVGELSLDAATYRVSFQGRELKVGPTEFKLLHYFMKHPERVHTRGTLLDRIWGDHVFIEERTVDVHVKRLRESLGEAGTMIETVRGAGYRLSAQALSSAPGASANTSKTASSSPSA